MGGQRAAEIEARKPTHKMLAATSSTNSSHPNQPLDHAHEATPDKNPDATITPIISTPRLADFASSMGKDRGTPSPPRLGSSAKTGSAIMPGNSRPREESFPRRTQAITPKINSTGRVS